MNVTREVPNLKFTINYYYLFSKLYFCSMHKFRPISDEQPIAKFTNLPFLRKFPFGNVYVKSIILEQIMKIR